MSHIPINPHGTPVEMLAQTEELYRWSALELITIINALKEGNSTDAKAAGLLIRDLRTSLGWALDEKNNVQKISKALTAAANGGGEGYDLGAARDEVGRRLARLRATKDDRGVSGGPE